LPGELIQQVDKVAGKRKRSRFVEEAIREKLEREQLGEVLAKSAGILKDEKISEWETPEKTGVGAVLAQER
jgi:metal-responsive CopG/Arc/MetJ family transcriptional regulator